VNPPPAQSASGLEDIGPSASRPASSASGGASERLRPAPNFSWRGPLLARLPENAKVAGTPLFWERVREELWESIRQKREYAGLCAFEELPDGLLLYDIERRWEGSEENAEVVFEDGDLLWHTHPNDFLQEANDNFSAEDTESADSAGKPLVLFSFGKSSPGYLAQFLLAPNLATILAGLSIRGVLELERRGVLPPNLMRFGIRGRVYIPGRGVQDILRVDEERPRDLSKAELLGIDRYTQPAWESTKEFASDTYEKGKEISSNAWEKGREFGGVALERGKELGASALEVSKDALEKGKELGASALEEGQALAKKALQAGKFLFSLKKKRDDR
jgi:hypothetical protein